MSKSMAVVMCFIVLLGLNYSLGESCELHNDDFPMEEPCTTVACKDFCVGKFELRTVRAGCGCVSTNTCRCLSSCPSCSEVEMAKAHICEYPFLSTCIALMLTYLYFWPHNIPL